MPVYLSPQPRGPVARAIATLIGALVLVGAFMLGMVAFLVMLGAGLLGGVWLWFRNWRMRRAGASTAGTSPHARPGASGGEVIEGEYSVVSQDEDRPS